MAKTYSMTINASVSLCPAASKMKAMVESGNTMVKTVIGTQPVNGKMPLYIDEEKGENLYGLLSLKNTKDEDGNPVDEPLFIRAVVASQYTVAIETVNGNKFEGKLTITLDNEVKAEQVNANDLDPEIDSWLKEAEAEGRMSYAGGLDRVEYMAKNYVPKPLIKKVIQGWAGENNVVKKKAMYVDPELEECHMIGEPGKVADAIMCALQGHPVILKGPKSTGKNTLVNSVLYTLGYEMEYDVANADKVTADYMSHERTDNSAAEMVAKMDSRDLMAAEIAKAKAAGGIALTKEDKEALITEATFKKLQAQCSSVRIISSYKAFARVLMDDRKAMFLDEINMGDANSLVSLLHGILDHSIDYVDIEGLGKVPLRRQVIVFAAMNCGYAGAQEMNDATRSRFAALMLGQPKSIIPILKSSMAYELNGKELDEKYFRQAESFYNACKASVMGTSKPGQYSAGTISDVCLNIRGIVRALKNVHDFEGCTTLRHELKVHVINPCDDQEHDIIVPLLNQNVDC